MSYNIRKYDSADLDQVMLAWETASALAHPFLSEEFVESERRNIPEVYMPNAETWVIEDGDGVFGFIALIGNEVGGLFVSPAFHKKGAGRALMDLARELNDGNLEVEVFKENHIGRRFYDRYGFRELHERLHKPSGHVVVRMRYGDDP